MMKTTSKFSSVQRFFPREDIMLVKRLRRIPEKKMFTIYTETAHYSTDKIKALEELVKHFKNMTTRRP